MGMLRNRKFNARRSSSKEKRKRRKFQENMEFQNGAFWFCFLFQKIFGSAQGLFVFCWMNQSFTGGSGPDFFILFFVCDKSFDDRLWFHRYTIAIFLIIFFDSVWSPRKLRVFFSSRFLVRKKEKKAQFSSAEFFSLLFGFWENWQINFLFLFLFTSGFSASNQIILSEMVELLYFDVDYSLIDWSWGFCDYVLVAVLFGEIVFGFDSHLLKLERKWVLLDCIVVKLLVCWSVIWN